jgi:hypothetical protein
VSLLNSHTQALELEEAQKQIKQFQVIRNQMEKISTLLTFMSPTSEATVRILRFSASSTQGENASAKLLAKYVLSTNAFDEKGQFEFTNQVGHPLALNCDFD